MRTRTHFSEPGGMAERGNDSPHFSLRHCFYTLILPFSKLAEKKQLPKLRMHTKKTKSKSPWAKKKSEKLLGKNYNVLKLTNGRSQVLQSFKITQTPHISTCNSSSKYSAFNNLLHKLSNYTLCTTILSLCAKNALAAFQTMLHNGLMWIVWLL